MFELYRRQAEEAKQRRKPQPIQTQWAKGSLEWLAEQNVPPPPILFSGTDFRD